MLKARYIQEKFIFIFQIEKLLMWPSMTFKVKINLWKICIQCKRYPRKVYIQIGKWPYVTFNDLLGQNLSMKNVRFYYVSIYINVYQHWSINEGVRKIFY